MTTIFKTSQIDRGKLREIIINNPGCLDPALSFIDKDISTDEGIIDFLGVDKTGGLVIVNIDIEKSDEALISVLSQIQWLKKSESLIKRLYSDEKIDFSLPTKIYLVSSCFSEKIKSAVKQILMENIKLIRFKYLSNKDQKAIFFEEIFCNLVTGEPGRPVKEEKSKAADFLTFNPTNVAEGELNVDSSQAGQGKITPEEIAEFMDFDKTLLKERSSK